MSMRFLAAMAAVTLAGACEQQSSMTAPEDAPVMAAAVTLPSAAAPNEVWLCKDAPSGSFAFTVSVAPTSGTPLVPNANPTIAADACAMVASDGSGNATITETDPSPFLLDKVEIYEIPLQAPTTRVLLSTQFTLQTSSHYGDRGLIFVYYNVAPPSTGCTLTLGYWKTHNATFPGGAPVDPTWALLPGGLAEGTTFFLSGMTWYEVFWTPVGGNAYYNLAHQYMAAKLNVLAGANPAAVSTALSDAETLFNTYTPAQIGALSGSNNLRKQFIALAGTLGSYNEGLTGPGHCSGDVILDP
jgi:hypothetical protein